MYNSASTNRFLASGLVREGRDWTAKPDTSARHGRLTGLALLSITVLPRRH